VYERTEEHRRRSGAASRARWAREKAEEADRAGRLTALEDGYSRLAAKVAELEAVLTVPGYADAYRPRVLTAEERSLATLDFLREHGRRLA
jgi:hypothetical protein